MKRILFALALFLIPVAAHANPIDDKCPQFVFVAAPVSSLVTLDQYLCKTNYAIHYNDITKTPEYVVEHPTISAVTGPAKRKNDFHPDTGIPVQYEAKLSDYNKDYDRGHMCPAGDNTQSAAIMSESFNLSNMVPQVPNNNRGIWKKLETDVRTWVLEKKSIYVISGPVYNKGYATIGADKVAVPQRLFKVIIDVTDGKVIAFEMPNAVLDVSKLPSFAEPIYVIEQDTGIKFSLPAGIKDTDFPDVAFWKP